jgi:hypothetical protein
MFGDDTNLKDFFGGVFNNTSSNSGEEKEEYFPANKEHTIGELFKLAKESNNLSVFKMKSGKYEIRCKEGKIFYRCYDDIQEAKIGLILMSIGEI